MSSRNVRARQDNGATSLTGLWSGEYWYGDGERRTKFVAQLIETYGAVEGVTLEQVRFFGREELSALLSGSRHEGQVTFTKAYDEAAVLGLAPVAYTGVPTADFSEVQGEWRLISRDKLQGGFVMRRISSHRAFGLRGREERAHRKALSDKEIRARQDAIAQRRRVQIAIVKPRRRKPKPP